MDCFYQAKQQTGIDPVAPAPPPPQAQQQAKHQEKQRKDTFIRVFAACLESKGYTVK